MRQTEDKMEGYLRSVSRNLRLSKDMKKRVESDLRTDIQLRLESGQDMDEIIEELGSPVEAAGYFNEEMAGGETSPHPWVSWIFLLGAGISLILLISWWILTAGVGKAVSIIGGADGPTSIFIAGKIGSPYAYMFWGLGIVLGFLAAFLLARKHRAHRRNKAALALSAVGTACFLLGIFFRIPNTGTGCSLWYLIQVFFAGDYLFLFVVSLLPIITLIIGLFKGK